MALLSFDVFWRDHGAARGARELGENSERSAQQFEGLKDAVKLGAAAAGVAIVAMGKKSIEVANDIAESQSKVTVVFGKSAKSVQDFAETTATSMGISKRAALEATGTFGNLLVSLKLPQEQAAKMSIKMVTLAADMASFNNASPEEALDAIRSGLMGETEPLQRFGVNMNDATLRTQALKMGLIGSVKQGLDPAVKAQAAYGLMLAQAGTAQGDFARTSDGMANQQRILKARFEDLEGELGEKLLPSVNKVLTGLGALLTIIDKNQAVILPMVGACGALAISIWAVNKAAMGATRSIAAWNIIMNSTVVSTLKARTAMMSLYSTTVIGAAGAAVFGAAWLAKVVSATDVSKTSVDDLTRSMEKNTDQVKLSSAELEMFGTSNGWAGNGLLNFTDDTDKSANALKHFGEMAHNALDEGWVARGNRFLSLTGNEKAFRTETAKLDEAFTKMVRDGNAEEAANQIGQYQKAAKDAGIPVSALMRLFPRYTAAMKDNTPEVVRANAVMVKHRVLLEYDTVALLKNAQALLKIRGDENAFEASVDDATQSLKDNGRTLDKHTEKGRANRAAIDQVASATLAWRDSAREAGKTTEEQNKILNIGRDRLIEMAKKFGMGGKAAKRYADEVLGIPKKVYSKITLDLDNKIPKTLYGVRIGGVAGSRVGGVTMATGGPVWGGRGGVDDVPAMLMKDEHVWTTREVKAAGGHEGMFRLRKAVLAGTRMADGGPVLGAGISARFSTGLEQLATGVTGRLAKRIEQIAQAAIGYNPSLNGALSFARAQVGKPYVWGGVGPGGYDCSGFMSALLNVVQGRSPYSRRFSTGNFPAAGFVPGPGSFMIGSRRGLPGHMAGTINGVNVESSGGVGPHMGKGARGARDGMFSGVYHLKGYAAGGPVGDAPYDLLNPNGQHYLGNALRKAILFDGGGMLASGGMAVNRSGRPERVLSGRQTASFDQLVRVVERGASSGAQASGSTDIDYAKMGDHMTRALIRAGVTVKMDGRAIGQLLGTSTSLTGRTG